MPRRKQRGWRRHCRHPSVTLRRQCLEVQIHYPDGDWVPLQELSLSSQAEHLLSTLARRAASALSIWAAVTLSAFVQRYAAVGSYQR